MDAEGRAMQDQCSGCSERGKSKTILIPHKRIRPLTATNQRITKSMTYDFVIQELQPISIDSLDW